jgi:D-alanyl-lipoteichoic acid acyltransferase DltB (MBOAT superfamily)
MVLVGLLLSGGGLHGVALVVHKMWQQTNIKLNIFLAWFLTFNFVNIAWIFFRAKDIESALYIIKAMFSFDSNFTVNYLECGGIILAFLIVLFAKNTDYLLKSKFNFNMIEVLSFSVLLFFSIIAIRMNHASEFLYFNF